jgi:pyrroline-5-carboxylate reductase
MGTSIIRGLQNALHDETFLPRNDTPIGQFHFLACVRRPESTAHLNNCFASDGDMVTIVENDIVGAAEKADVIILGCKPNALHEVLGSPGMGEALNAKLLISILAGTTESQICQALSQAKHENTTEIICAIPNIASNVSRSMTVVALPDSSVSPKFQSLASGILSRLGWSVHVPSEQVNISTVLCASGPAYVSLVLEALADAAIARGVARSEALEMAARTMQGTAELILQGEAPDSVRKRVCTPGGCSAQGLEVLERAGVADTFIEALHEAEKAIGQLSLRK